MARWGRLSAVAISCASALLAATPSAGAPASHATPKLKVSQTQAMPGEILWFRGRDADLAHRLVKLQRRVHGRWRTVEKVQAKGGGGFALRARVPAGVSAVRDQQFRVIPSGVRVQGVTGRRAVDVVAQSVDVTGVTELVAGSWLTAPVSVTPSRVGRSAWIEAWEAGEWRRLEASTIRLGQTATAIPSVQTAAWPTWLRATASRWRGAEEISSDPFVTHLDAPVDIVAHRGGAAGAPESTLAAVRHSLAVGVDAIEADVRRTADGQLVILHDDTLTRTTNVAAVFPERVSHRVNDYTLKELEQLDAGSWFGPTFAGEPVPTLANWISAITEPTRIILEVKTPRGPTAFTSDLLDLLSTNERAREAIAAGRLIIASADLDWLERFATSEPGVALAALYSCRPSALEMGRVASWADIVVAPALTLDDSLAKEAHNFGLKLQLYTPNSEYEMRQAVATLPDGILTDAPELLRRVIEPPAPGFGRTAGSSSPDALEAELRLVGACERTVSRLRPVQSPWEAGVRAIDDDHQPSHRSGDGRYGVLRVEHGPATPGFRRASGAHPES